MRNLVLGVIVLLVLLLALDGVYEVKQTERAVSACASERWNAPTCSLVCISNGPSRTASRSPMREC